MRWLEMRKIRLAQKENACELHASANRIVAFIQSGKNDGSIQNYLQHIIQENPGSDLAQKTEQALTQVLDTANDYLQGKGSAQIAREKFQWALRTLAYMTYVMDVQHADQALQNTDFMQYVSEFLHDRNPGKSYLKIRNQTITLPPFSPSYKSSDEMFILDCEVKRSDGKLNMGPLFPLLAEVAEFCHWEHQQSLNRVPPSP